MNFPDGVVNKGAYLKYQKYAKHKILNEDSEFEASDGTVIKLGWLPHHLKKKIAHLPVKEQSDIISKKDLYFKQNNNATVQRRLAFGMSQGRPNKQGNQTILDVRGAEIIDHFARMFTAKEILKIINEDWKIKFSSIKKLKEFRVKHAKEIDEANEKYRQSFSDVRLSVKRSRLDELTFIYNKQKQKFIDTKSNESSKIMLQSLEAIRKESEGDRLTIDGRVDVNYEVNIQSHLRDEVFRTMNIKEIILGRVAARMGINPIKLIHSLNDSYYKKFSNVLGDFNEEEAEGTELIYPSQMNYDFERIRKAQKNIDHLVEEAVEVEEKKEAEKDSDKAQSIKEKMLEKLKAKQEKLKGHNSKLNSLSKNKKEK